MVAYKKPQVSTVPKRDGHIEFQRNTPRRPMPPTEKYSAVETRNSPLANGGIFFSEID